MSPLAIRAAGSTGPGSAAPDGRPWGSRFPRLTIRDQVTAEARLADALEIPSWHTVIGGSMGGMRTLEWVASYPDRVGTAVALASTAYATAEQIGWSQTQIHAIRNDPWFAGGDYYGHPQGPEVGLGIARRIAHITYRSEIELHDRFGQRHIVARHPLDRRLVEQIRVVFEAEQDPGLILEHLQRQLVLALLVQIPKGLQMQGLPVGSHQLVESRRVEVVLIGEGDLEDRRNARHTRDLQLPYQHRERIDAVVHAIGHAGL